MSLPVSTKWDRIDYSFRAETGGEGYTEGSRLFSDVDYHLEAESFIQYPNVLIEEGFVYLNALTSERINAVKEVSSVVTSAEIVGGIPENFTIEFDIYLTDDALPKSFTDTENRLFVGAINVQGSSAGFLFSYDGIAYATHPTDPAPSILAGSKNLLFSDDGTVRDGVFLRAVLNGEDDRMYVYTSSSDSAYLTASPEQTEASLMWSVKARAAGGQYSDAVIFHASSRSAAQQLFDKPDLVEAEGQDVSFALGSFRMSGSKVLPVDRPTAVATGDLQVVVGSALQLDGLGSFDSEGRQLTYDWEFELKPTGSKARMQGAAYASTVLYRVEEDESTTDVVTLTFDEPSSKYNTYKAVVTVGEPNSLLTMDLDHEAETLYIVLGADSDGEVNVSGSDLVEGFYNSKAAGFNITISGGELSEVDRSSEDGAKIVVRQYPREVRASLTAPESSGLEMLQAGTFSFSGGAGSRLSTPLVIPDVVGSYIVSLTVYNNVRYSDKTKLAFSVTLTEQLLGHRPNSEYIFKYLPDFWNMVKDKQHLTALWSSITQVLSSEMMSLWQNDYAKALKDTVRKYQRRWIQHEISEYWPADEPATLSEFDESILLDLSVTEPIEGTHNTLATVSSAEIYQPLVPGKALLYSDISPPEVIDITSVTYTEDDDSTWEIVTSLASFPVYKLIDDRTGGYFVRDLEDITPTTPLVSSVLYDPTYPFVQINSEVDRVRLYKTDGSDVVVSVTAYDVGGVKNTIRLDLEEDEAVDGVARSWEHLRVAQYTKVIQSSYITLPDTSSLKETYVVGDYVTLRVVDPYTSGDIDVTLTILAIDGQDIFVEWYDLLVALNGAALLNGDERVWVHADLPELDWVFRKVTMHNRTHASEDLVNIPFLGTDTVKNAGVYREFLDYDVKDTRIYFDNLIEGTASISDGTRVKLDPNFLQHALISPYCDTKKVLDFEEAAGLGLSCLVIENGPAGVYQILGYDEDTGEFIINSPDLSNVSDLRVYAPRMCSYYPGPERFWAELSYYDNSQTVENNFGLFVGFPKELVDEYDPSLDYLSVIKSMWFAFMSGPHFDNLQLAVQALFNLPYTEQPGRVLYAQEATSETEGRIILVDEDERQQVFVLPAGTSLATNPRTGRTIKGFTFTDDLEGLTDEQLEDREDSILDAYVKLVDVVKIDDYISDEDIINKQFGGNVRQFVDDDGVIHEVDISPTIIEKYHTFLVNVPLEITHSTSVFPLVQQFLNEAKPAYTNFILVGSLNFVDEVSVLEEAILMPTIILRDTPHTAPFMARYDGEGLSYTTILPALDETGAPVIDADTGLPTYTEQTVAQAIVTAERQASLWPTYKTLEKVAVIDDSPLVDEFEYKVLGRIGRGDMLDWPYETYSTPEEELNNSWTPSTGFFTEDPTLAGLTLGEAGVSERTIDFWRSSHWDVCFVVMKDDLPYEYTTETPVLGYRVTDASEGTVSWVLSEMFANLVGNNTEFTTTFNHQQIFALRIKDTPHFMYVTPEGGAFILDFDNAITDGDIQTIEIVGYRFGLPLGRNFYQDPDTELADGESPSLNPLSRWYREGEGALALCDVYFWGDVNGDGIHDRFVLDEDGVSTGVAKTIEDIPKPEVTYWDMDDVFEKYEAGYCEGVLDDYSGDGSWNKARTTLDMVNTWNSDLDVVRSKVWVPVEKTITSDEDAEFVLGEKLSVRFQGAEVEGHIWNAAPPVVDHVGSGGHPKVPFGVVSPQNAHVHTYLLFGFEATYEFTQEALSLKEDESEELLPNNYANESRLDWYNHLYQCLVDAELLVAPDPLDPTDVTFVGLTSGAVAKLAVDGIAAFDTFGPDEDATKSYYHLETIWQQDKLIEYGPVSDPDIIITKYIPLGGMTIADYQASSFCFNPGGGISDDPSVPPAFVPVVPFTYKENPHWSYGDEDDDGVLDLDHHTRTRISEAQAHYYNLEAQCHVPDLTISSNEQFSPSFSPGYFTWWDNVPVPTTVDGVGSGIVPASEVLPLLVWGYADQGKLSAANPVAHTGWEPPAEATALQNVHIGMKVKARKTKHLTHGFTEFYIPAPTIKMIVPASSGYDLRVCGFYFCNDDPTRVELPTETTHDGSIGGSWVFMRNSVTKDEFLVTDWSFETGVHEGRHIVPKGPLRDGLSTWVLGREPDPADASDPGQRSDGHIIEFNIPTLSEEGYYDVIVRNYRPWYMGSDVSEEKRNVHIDTVIAERAYYYSTEGFGGASWGTSPWGSTE